MANSNTEKEKKDKEKRVNIVVDPDLHKRLKVATAETGETLRDFVSKAIEEKLNKMGK